MNLRRVDGREGMYSTLLHLRICIGEMAYLVSVGSEATLVGIAEAYDRLCSGSFDRTYFPV